MTSSTTETVFRRWVACGTYEGGLVGVRITKEKDDLEIQQEFGFTAHVGGVKSVAASGNLLVSGGKDETLRIFDMNKKTETGTIGIHQGTILCCDIWSNQYIISGDEKGQMTVTRISDWTSILNIKAHPSPLIALSIHPSSGRLALSLGENGQLRMWDLTRGTSAFNKECVSPVDNLRADSQIVVSKYPKAVQWSSSGDYFTLLFERCVERIFPATDDCKHVEGVFSAIDCTASYLVCGDMKGAVHVMQASTMERLTEEKGVAVTMSKVKGIVTVDEGLHCFCDVNGNLGFFTVKVDDGKAEVEVVHKISTGARLTSLCSSFSAPITVTPAARSAEVREEEPRGKKEKTQKKESKEKAKRAIEKEGRTETKEVVRGKGKGKKKSKGKGKGKGKGRGKEKGKGKGNK